MTTHALSQQEVNLLRKEIEILMQERQSLLQVSGAAAVLIANLDPECLPDEQDTIDAAEMLAEYLNVMPEELMRESLASVQAEFDPEAQAEVQ